MWSASLFGKDNKIVVFESDNNEERIYPYCHYRDIYNHVDKKILLIANNDVELNEYFKNTDKHTYAINTNEHIIKRQISYLYKKVDITQETIKEHFADKSTPLSLSRNYLSNKQITALGFIPTPVTGTYSFFRAPKKHKFGWVHPDGYGMGRGRYNICKISKKVYSNALTFEGVQTVYSISEFRRFINDMYNFCMVVMASDIPRSKDVYNNFGNVYKIVLRLFNNTTSYCNHTRMSKKRRADLEAKHREFVVGIKRLKSSGLPDNYKLNRYNDSGIIGFISNFKITRWKDETTR